MALLVLCPPDAVEKMVVSFFLSEILGSPLSSLGYVLSSWTLVFPLLFLRLNFPAEKRTLFPLGTRAVPPFYRFLLQCPFFSLLPADDSFFPGDHPLSPGFLVISERGLPFFGADTRFDPPPFRYEAFQTRGPFFPFFCQLTPCGPFRTPLGKCAFCGSPPFISPPPEDFRFFPSNVGRYPPPLRGCTPGRRRRFFLLRGISLFRPSRVFRAEVLRRSPPSPPVQGGPLLLVFVSHRTFPQAAPWPPAFLYWALPDSLVHATNGSFFPFFSRGFLL